MPVYVETGRPYWRRLVADTREELEGFAALIGVSAAHDEGTHYFVSPFFKHRALEYGATYKTSADISAITLRLSRQEVP